MSAGNAVRMDAPGIVESEAPQIADAAFDRLTSQERARHRHARAQAVKDAEGAAWEGKRRQARGRRGPGPGHGHGPGGGPGMPAGEKPADFRGTMRALLAFMGQFKVHLAVILIFAIGSTLFNIAGPKVLSEATTALFEGVVGTIAGTSTIDYALIGRILITTLVLYVFSAVCSWVQSWTMTYVSQQICYRLRGALARKIDRMPFGYFEKSATGDTLSRITNDVDTLGQSLNQGVTQMITSAVTIVGVIAMMLSINWLMTLITLVMVPVSLVLVMVVVRLSQKHFFAQQRLLGQVNAQAEETFSGHAVVKAFGQEDETVRLYNQANDALYEAGWKSQFLSGLMQPVMSFVGNLGYVAVAVVGALLAVRGAITVGDIQAFIQYVKNFTQPITQLAQVGNVLQQMAAAAERIFACLDQPELSDDTRAHGGLMTLPGGYDFEINEEASNISQGQRQLITIARALLADRRMLILDEATSSVDTRTEARIQQAMDNLMEGRTSFVIAHRLSTIRNADLILVMQQGDIVDQGTHDQLLAEGGFYAELYNAQFAGYDEAEDEGV